MHGFSDAVVDQLMRVPVGRVALHLEVVLVVLTSLLVHVRVQADLKRDIFRDRGK